ncbi:molybdopterin-dependent oxidoreductase [Elstera cyanobacteriorum]|uniref:molybdopterin-dependent oxidoreductase n=1 Tax=Elstera cyanobacteriorum TaxID=2022747 RepID=UPI002353C0D4|nr:molybdopterin cofactor-binding domain-containing protein [Elstera cyanobacteriorum]MCK6441418.1 molybdopterin-dependent oxidoreductase [Elstera cyanobacteriorum]
MIDFHLNGTAITASAAATTPAAQLLRDQFGLTGLKIGCGSGDCGACTILIDGAPRLACLTPVTRLAAREVTTVEGLPPALLARVTEALVRAGAIQCGFCLPGLTITLAALLLQTPPPSPEERTAALAGHLCRCTGYTALAQTVAALFDGEALPENREGIGNTPARRDGAAKAAGTAEFAADTAPPGAWGLRVLRAPDAPARFALGDLSAFRAAHPALLVLTAADIPGRNGHGVHPDHRVQPVLAAESAAFPGEPVLALVGPEDALARVADADLPITWTPLPAPPPEVFVERRVHRGDMGAALATAPVSITRTATTGAVAQAALEPEAGWAEPWGDGGVSITATTQAPTLDREQLAAILGLPEAKIQIVTPVVGGGFGGKLDLSVQPLLALAVVKTGRSVRWTYSRAESLAVTPKRHPSQGRVQIAATRDGDLLAIDLAMDLIGGAYASWGRTVVDRVPIHGGGPYRLPAYHGVARGWRTASAPKGAFRGFGVPQAALLLEPALDQLAARLGIDPLELRRRNALRPGDTTVTGQRLTASVGLLACLDALAPAWRRARSAAATGRAGPLKHGVGLACLWYGIGNTSQSNPSHATVRRTPEDDWEVLTGAVDIGQGSDLVLAQIAAETLGVALDRIRLITGPSRAVPDGGKTSASRQSFITGEAVRRAARAALANPDGMGDGVFDPPTTPLDADGQGSPYAAYAFGAQMAEVTVDSETGVVRVIRVTAAHDVGRVLNRQGVEGQIAGGILQGLGMALFEAFDPETTRSFGDYRLPRLTDAPEIVCHLIESPHPLGPFGAKGIGEPALIATAPAILNAIGHACGVWPDQVPVTPDILRKLLYP